MNTGTNFIVRKTPIFRIKLVSVSAAFNTYKPNSLVKINHDTSIINKLKQTILGNRYVLFHTLISMTKHADFQKTTQYF